MLTDNIPNEITSSDFFVFKSILFYNLSAIPSIKLLEGNNDNMSISNWFIHSKPNNMILKYTKLFLEEYWKNENKLINYFFFHYWITFLIINNKECAQIYNNMPNKSNFAPHLLQNNLFRAYDEELFNEIKSLTPIHKLTYKYKMLENKNLFINKIIETKI